MTSEVNAGIANDPILANRMVGTRGTGRPQPVAMTSRT